MEIGSRFDRVEFDMEKQTIKADGMTLPLSVLFAVFHADPRFMYYFERAEDEVFMHRFPIHGAVGRTSALAN